MKELLHRPTYQRQSNGMLPSGKTRYVWFVKCKCGWSPDEPFGKKKLAKRRYVLHVHIMESSWR